MSVADEKTENKTDDDEEVVVNVEDAPLSSLQVVQTVNVSDRFGQMEAQMAAMHKLFEEMSLRANQTQKQVLDLKSEVKDRSVRAAQLEEVVGGLQAELNAVRDQLAVKDQQIVNLEHALDAKDQKIGALEQAIELKDAQHNQVIALSKEKDAKLEELRVRLESLEQNQNAESVAAQFKLHQVVSNLDVLLSTADADGKPEPPIASDDVDKETSVSEVSPLGAEPNQDHGADQDAVAPYEEDGAVPCWKALLVCVMPFLGDYLL
jgi:chromosome segregation ATPase